MRPIILLIALLTAAPTLAQEVDHSGHGAAVAPADPHAGHQMAMPDTPVPTPPATDPHAGHRIPAQPAAEGKAPAPPTDRAADRYFPPAEMALARAALHREHGAMTVSQMMIDLAEIRPGKHGYGWDGEAWIGGDIDRLIVSSEGEGGASLDHAEVQALWGHALDPYWNLQAGVRQDIRPRPGRSYAVLGLEGLAPYWFEIEATLFLSSKGDISARLEAYYDQRITQRLILQPRIELEAAASDDRTIGIGAGLASAEIGLRLRYEVERRFAPYLGVVHERRFGRTGRFAVAEGEGRRETRAVLGVRAWF